MVLPSKEVIRDIRNLIYEITKFERNEENFYICEQYCLSHVMHHSYPSVNRNDVKKLVDGYIHRFFVHGYFKIADELEAQVKKFLSSEALFQKNPESDIQWSLLSLLIGLTTNLSSVWQLPKIMSGVDDEKSDDDINWGEYLKEGLPEYKCSDDNSDSELSFYSQNSDVFTECESGSSEPDLNENEQNDNISRTTENGNTVTFSISRQHIIDELVRRREEEISYTRDIVMRGNFIEELGFFMNARASFEPPQILSEYEAVGLVLNQLLTGENVFKKRGINNPATCGLTPNTLRNYLSSIQPYVNMISVFKEFHNEVTHFDPGSGKEKKEANSKAYNIYSNLNKSCTDKKSVPNVIKLYDLALSDALHLFESKILLMSEHQNSFTLIKILHELRPSFNDLSSLFTVHLTATANWVNEPNWLCSIRIILTLYKAVLHSVSNRLGFLYMNMFLFCFQAYLDITDNWISCLSLIDPNDEYLIYRYYNAEIETYSYQVRPYKEELPRLGMKDMEILDYLANKMIHVGHSIDVLNRLDRSLIKKQSDSVLKVPRESFYKILLKNIKGELLRTAEALTVTENSRDIGIYTRAWSIPNCVERDKFESDLFRTHSMVESDEKNNNRVPEVKKNQTKESDVLSSDIALSKFCLKLCQDDKSDSIERSPWPICVIIQRFVKEILNERVFNTCDSAKEVVVKEFQLKTHLGLLRNVFLFNEPHLIQPFMNALFNQESVWQNCYALTVYLRECIESRYRDQAQYLSLSIENSKKRPKNLLEFIDRLTINYQVEWPLQLVFTPKIMALYNEIFRNLLKLHWAHETLCRLQFADAGKDTSETFKSLCRRLNLLRFWCLSSYARLRTYFMAQVSTPFNLLSNNYPHLKDILKGHEAFLRKIHHRCLLHHESINGKELVYNVLIPLCTDIHQFWTNGIKENQLSKTESLFEASIKDFTRLMTKLEQE